MIYSKKSAGHIISLRNGGKYNKIYSTINLSSQKNQQSLKTLCEEQPKVCKQYMNEWKVTSFRSWKTP